MRRSDLRCLYGRCARCVGKYQTISMVETFTTRSQPRRRISMHPALRWGGLLAGPMATMDSGPGTSDASMLYVAGRGWRKHKGVEELLAVGRGTASGASTAPGMPAPRAARSRSTARTAARLPSSLDRLCNLMQGRRQCGRHEQARAHMFEHDDCESTGNPMPSH